MTTATADHAVGAHLTDRRPLERRGPARDTWGGTTLVLFLVGAFGFQVIRRLIDGEHNVPGPDGEPVAVMSGHLSTAWGVGLFALAVGAAVLAMLAPSRTRVGSLVSLGLQVLVVWWVTTSVLFPRVPHLSTADLLIIGAIPLALGVVSSPPTLLTVRRLNLLRDAFGVASLVHSFISPSIASLECRSDKCGIFGNMQTGFYLQENATTSIMSLLLPLAAASSLRRLGFSWVVAMLVALGSGSRTGAASTLIAGLLALYLNRSFHRGRQRIVLPRWLLMLPLLATFASLAIFLFVKPTALTGRGQVYAAILGALKGPEVLFGVPWDTVSVATHGSITGDHGQASHVLARAGVIGLLCWIAAMLAMTRKVAHGPEAAIGLAILIGGAPRMMTETTFDLEARATGFLALLVAMGLCAAGGGDAARLPQLAPRQWKALGSVAALAVTLLAVVPPLLPTSYAARAEVLAALPVPTSTDGDESLDARRIASDSANALGQQAAFVQGVVDGLPAASRDGVSSVEASKDLGTVVVHLVTTGSDPAAARAANDAVAERLSSALTNAAGTPTTAPARLVVRPLGDSVVAARNPWRAHIEVVLLLAISLIAAGIAAVRRTAKNDGPPSRRPYGGRRIREDDDGLPTS